MNIVTIVPGFGGTFYCGNCLRDSAFVQSMRATGNDAITLPIYLPLSMQHGYDESDTPVFYGAVSIYMKQQFRLFRNMPHWMERLFNSRPMMKIAAKKAGSTRAEGLEEMTISMLRGHEGFQKEELNELVSFLRHHAKPDIVHLSNALLIGLAAKIKEELNIPVVCSLQDEDVWIDAMRPSYRQKLWNLMAEKGNDVDAFISVSHYFASLMQTKMNIQAEKIFVNHIGVEPSQYTFRLPDENAPTIGYLSRLCFENGFDIVVDAFILLKKEPEFKNVRLKVTGGSTGDDVRFIRQQRKKLEKSGVLNDVDFVDAYFDEPKKQFLASLSLLSVPVRNGEAFGLYQLEAIASGTPIVQPSLGAFPEIVNLSGGGMVYEENTAEHLAHYWKLCLSDFDQLVEIAKAGKQGVNQHFSIHELSKKMIDIYNQVTTNA